MNAKTSKEGMDESATDTDQKDTPVYDAWLANADKIKLEDPLLECLVILARENGRKTSLIALTSGLPLSQEGFASPALFVRAANRVDMSAKLVKRPLRDLSKSPSLPCILILERNVSCILRSVKDDYANITLPERPNETISVKISELESSYKGYAFFLSRKVKLDARAGPNKNLGSRHWFWSTIFRHKRVYAQVVIATVFINILALVSPIYIMNVYDRVLPNNAFDTLIVLATGATLAMVFDFILKNIRAHFLDAAGRKSDIRISSKIFEHILNVKIAERPASSGVLADNMREFETLRDFFTSATVTTLIDLPFAFFFIFLIYIIGGALAIVPLAVLFAIIVFGLILQKPMGRAINENMREGAFKSSL